MNNLLFVFMILCEIVLATLTIVKKADRVNYKLCRLLTNIGEVVVFLIMLLLPGIDLSMRFKGFFLLLWMRVLFAGLSFGIAKGKDIKKEKKVLFIITDMLGSILLFFLFMIPAFVISDYKGLETTGAYTVAQAKAILVDDSRVEAFEQDGSKREVPVYFFYPSDAAEGDKFPIVFFSHGAFGYYESNASTYLELASNGYIVISMEHPYHSIFTHDSEGKLITADQSFFQAVMKANENAEESTSRETNLASKEWIKLRLEDADFAIDTVKESIETGEVSDKWILSENQKDGISQALHFADKDVIGFMGHSLGGATAVTIGRQREDIKAVIDLDGTMLGERIVDEGGNLLGICEEEYKTPLLSFDNEAHFRDRMECIEKNEVYDNNVVLAHATCGFSTYIAKTAHMNYTDLPLFSPFFAKMLGVGEVDPKACTVKVNEIVLSFFNSYLKGEGSFAVEEGYHL